MQSNCKKIIFYIFFLLTSSTTVSANVIYDIDVTYDDGQYGSTYLFEYTFSMEFADATGIKNQTDLIGGDFQNSSMRVYNNNFFSGWQSMDLITNDIVSNLSFDADNYNNSNSLQFHSDDVFQIFDKNGTKTSSSGMYDDLFVGSYINRDLRWAGAIFLPALDLSITLRGEKPRPVPEPGTLLLLLAGLCGIYLWRNKQKEMDGKIGGFHRIA